MSEDQSEKKLPGRIVCVDDDFDIRQIVRESFERSEIGKNIVFASCGSGKELLSRLRELQPNLLLLDLNLPEMNGPDIVDALRQNADGRDIPIIFLTGKEKVKMEVGYKSLGVIGVIYKPFDVKTLPQDVCDIWNNQGMESSGEGQVLTDLMDQDNEDTFKEEN